MKGISEERLQQIASIATDQCCWITVINQLLSECEELNEWKPIDSNTPTDKPILLLTMDNVTVEGYFVDLYGGYWVDGLNHDKIKPKGWQELLPPPKD